MKTTEKIVADKDGIYVVQSIRRVPAEQRYDGELLRSIRGTPWDPLPGNAMQELPELLPIELQLSEVVATPTAQDLHPRGRFKEIWFHSCVSSL